MRAVVQRVSRASVEVDGRIVGEIERGLLLLVAVAADDEPATADRLADRVIGCRLHNDEAGKINVATKDLEGAALLAVSNFTVLGDASTGRRPSFAKSAGFEKGKELFDRFVAACRERGVRTETGEFGADMRVALVNDGPVTLVLEA